VYQRFDKGSFRKTTRYERPSIDEVAHAKCHASNGRYQEKAGDDDFSKESETAGSATI
jgi:hypothetical protein